MIEEAPNSPPLTYDEADLYCMTLTYNGHYDWRLYTIRTNSLMPLLFIATPWRHNND